MANRWGNNGNSDRLYFGGSKITTDGDCSHEIKRHLLLGRKVMTNLDSILKSRNITLPTKVCLVKAMVFPVVMYGCHVCMSVMYVWEPIQVFLPGISHGPRNLAGVTKSRTQLKWLHFTSLHVWMWELEYKESWAPNTWRFWNGVLEKSLESPWQQGDQTSQS